MSVSKQWRLDLDSARSVINTKKSRHSTLFKQIDLTRFLDNEYISKLNDRNELFASSKLSSSKLSTNSNIEIADEEDICAFWRPQPLKTTTSTTSNLNDEICKLSHFLISQTTHLCQANIFESMSFKRRLLLQRIILSQPDNPEQVTSSSSKTISKSSTNTNAQNVKFLDNIESSKSFTSLPFEAQIGIKLLLSTLDSIDVEKDKTFCFKIIKSLLPHLNHFIATLSSSKQQQSNSNNHDFGLLNRICVFLCSMIDDAKNDILASILCTILALSIISNDFETILFVIHRILTHESCKNLKLPISESLKMISQIEDKQGDEFKSDYAQNSQFDGGSLYCFGKGEHGRLGLANYSNKQCTQPTINKQFSASNCLEIASFSSHNLCIDTEHNVYSWGKGEHGRLGNGQNKSFDIPRLLEPFRQFKVVHVAVGLSHSLILTEDGNVWSFGSGEHGRLGHGDSTQQRTPKLIESFSNNDNAHVTSICCGAYHSVCICSNGHCYTFGKNDQGQCGLGSVANKDVLVPTLVDLKSHSAVYADSGWEHTLLITSENLILSWGIGYEGHRPVLGHGHSEKAQLIPLIIEALKAVKVVDVSCGWDHSLCVSEEGKLYSWGDGTHGRLGHGANSHQYLPKIVSFFADKNIKIVACKGGSNHSAAITSLGELYMFGNGTDFQLGLGANNSAQKAFPTKVTGALDGVSIAKVSLGDKYTLCIKGNVVPSNGYKQSEYRSSMIGLERRRSSIFSGGDLNDLKDENAENLMITFGDRLNKKQHEITQELKENDEEKESEEDEESEYEEDDDESEESVDQNVYEPYTAGTILLAHLDRICGEKDFCSVDDAAKELRKLQNDPSLIQTNALIKRSCNESTLKYLFDIIQFFIKALAEHKPSISTPKSPMPQIEENEQNKVDNVTEKEDVSITYTYFILSCLRLLRSKVRIAALIYKEDREQYKECVGSFDFNHLQKSLLQFMGENDEKNDTLKLQNMDERIHRLIQFEATALLSAGIELFYPSHSTRIELVNTLLDGSSKQSVFTQALLAQFSQPALLQGFLPAMVHIEQENDDVHVQIDAAKLLDLLSILMKRSQNETLKMIGNDAENASGLSSTTAFLSCLQREALIWISKRLNDDNFVEKQWINILGEHANDLCLHSIDLCDKIMHNALTLVRHLKYSIVGSILPSFLFALGSMNFIEFIPNLMQNLTSLLLKLDEIYVKCASLKNDLSKYEWLINLEDVIATLITKGLSSKLLQNESMQEEEYKKQESIDYVQLLNSPLFSNGIKQSKASLIHISEEQKKREEDVENDRAELKIKQQKSINTKQFIQDLINNENEAKILCNWLHTNSKQSRIIPKINDNLHRIIRTAFVSYLYLSRSVYEALVYAQLIKSKGLPRSEVDISPPPELIVLWNQSLIVGQQCYFETRKLSQSLDVSDDESSKVIDKIKHLLDGFQQRAHFLLRIVLDNNQSGDESLILSLKNSPNLTPKSEMISIETSNESEIKAIISHKLSYWNVIKTRLRVISHWKALLNEKSSMTIKQRSYYRKIKEFICSTDIRLSVIDKIIKDRDLFALNRLEGLKQIRQLLTSLSCPSAKQKILKSIFVLYDEANAVTSSAKMIAPILKDLQSASPLTMQHILDMFHHILYDSTKTFADNSCDTLLRASVLGVWSMDIGSNSNELYSKTNIFGTICDILSVSGKNDDSFRMYIWSFFCLLFKQVIACNDHEQFLSAINVLLQQINHYRALLSESNNVQFPESITLIKYAKLDVLNEGYQFNLHQDVIKKYISQHGDIPNELKKSKESSSDDAISIPITSISKRDLKIDSVSKPTAYSGFKCLNDLRFYTIGFWIKVCDTDSTNPMQTILLRGINAKNVNPIIYFNKSDRKIYVEVSVSSGANVKLDSNQSLNLREWTHVLLIVRPENMNVSKSEIELYINGKFDNKKQSGAIKGGITSDKPIFVGRVPQISFNESSNRGGANCSVMNLTMSLYPMSAKQIDDFYQCALKQSLHYFTSHNFEIALNILMSQTVKFNDYSLVKRWLPIKGILVPLYDILKQQINENDDIIIQIMNMMEWILLICTPNEIKIFLSIHSIEEFVALIFEIAADALLSSSNSDRWYQRMAIGDRAVALIRTLLKNQDWKDCISAFIQKYRLNSASNECKFERSEIENLLISLHLFGGNRMVFRRDAMIQIKKDANAQKTDGVIAKYEQNMMSAHVIPFDGETHKITAHNLSNLRIVCNNNPLPYLSLHINDNVTPLINILISYQQSMKEWLDKEEIVEKAPIPLPLPSHEADTERQKEENEKKIEEKVEEPIESAITSLDLLQNVSHLMTLNTINCKKTENEFYPHPKFPIPASLKARIEREEIENKTETELERIEAMIEALSDIDDEKETNVQEPVIDYGNCDELSLLSSEIMVKILKVFKSFSSNPAQYKELFDSISSNNKLMKSLLFLSSLPIQFDDGSSWNELEQLQTNIAVSIKYHRMKHWIETCDYFKNQINLQKKYKSEANKYVKWLKEQQQHNDESQIEEKQDKEKEEKEQSAPIPNVAPIPNAAPIPNSAPLPEEPPKPPQLDANDSSYKPPKNDNESIPILFDKNLVVLEDANAEFHIDSTYDEEEEEDEDDGMEYLDPSDALIGVDANAAQLEAENKDINGDDSGINYLSDLSQDQQLPMAQLISMGFSHIVSRQCLEITNFNINEAIELAANFNEEEEALQFEDSASNQMMVDSLNAVPQMQPQLNVNLNVDGNDKPILQLVPDDSMPMDDLVVLDNEAVPKNDDDKSQIIQIKDLEKRNVEKVKVSADVNVENTEKEKEKQKIIPAPLPSKKEVDKMQAPPPKPLPLNPLNITKNYKRNQSENERRDKMANDAKKELVKIMSTLPDVADDAIPDATSNETALKPFDMAYFDKSAPFKARATSNLKNIFNDILKSKYPLSALLKLSAMINMGLSIYFSRIIVQNVFNESAEAENKEESENNSVPLMKLLHDEPVSDFYRFLKLYVFRNKPSTEKSQRKILKSIICKSNEKMKNELINCAIIELRTAAQNIHKYNNYEWGFRSLEHSDVKTLNEPRIELSLAILNEYVLMNECNISLEQFKRMNVCLRTANMPLKCHLFGIITKLLLSLDRDNLELLQKWIDCLPVNGLEHLARARFKKETSNSASAASSAASSYGYFSSFKAAPISKSKSSNANNRLLKSLYLTQLMELVVVSKSILDRIDKLKYLQLIKENKEMTEIDEINIFVIDVSSTSICIGWNTQKQANKLWPNWYILQMKTSKDSQWKTLMKGDGRQWLINKGLAPKKTYFFQMQPMYKSNEKDKKIIYGKWTSTVSVQTLPDLTWNPNKKGRYGTAEYLNGNTRVQLSAGADRWRTILANKGFNSGKHSWTMKIVKTDRIFLFVGVCSGSALMDTFVGGDQHGFGYFLQDHHRYHHRNKQSPERVASNHKFKTGDKVTLTLDFVTNSLSMSVNGTKYGDLFCGCFDSTEHWFPAISLYHKGDGIEFVGSGGKNDENHSKFEAAQKKQMEPFDQTLINFKDTLFVSKALSANGKLPKNVLNVAYSEWKSWYEDTLRVIKTMHDTFYIDVNDEKCKQNMNGYAVNDVIASSVSFGANFKLLGLAKNDGDEYKDFYYTKEGESEIKKGAIFVFLKEVSSKFEEKQNENNDEKEQKEEKTKENDDDDVESIDEENEIFEFMQNVTNSSRWTMERDSILLSASHQIASSMDMTIWSLLSIDFSKNDVYKFYKNKLSKSDISFKSLTQRFILLKIFNRSLSFILPFISFDIKYSSSMMLEFDNYANGIVYNYSSAISKYVFLIKSLIAWDSKNNLFEKLISDTNTFTAPNEDAYEDPPSLKKVTINRHKARKAKNNNENVVKNSIFYQLYNQLKYCAAADLRRNYVAKLDDGQERTFKVKFFGEGVQDNGGPYRETFHGLIDELFDHFGDTSLFIQSQNLKYSDGQIQDKYIPNPACNDFESLDLYRFFGKVIGICLRNHILINFNLASIVWKLLIGKHLNTIDLMQDIGEIDEGFVRQYNYVKNVNDKDIDSLSYINFTFKRSDDVQIELVPNGKNIHLNVANRAHYLKESLYLKMHEFDDQIASIRAGLAEVMPLCLLPIYTSKDLERKICGNSDFSVDLLKSITVYEGHLTAQSYHVQIFWNMMQSFTPNEKEMFLRFSWAKTRMPSKKSQFKGNTFKLQPFSMSSPSKNEANKADVNMLLPKSHTCFFSLQLPSYSSLKIMKERFLYAFNNAASMDRDLKLQDSELYNYEQDDL